MIDYSAIVSAMNSRMPKDMQPDQWGTVLENIMSLLNQPNGNAQQREYSYVLVLYFTSSKL